LNYYTGQYLKWLLKRSSNGFHRWWRQDDDLTGIFLEKHEWCWNFFVRPHLLGGGRIESFPETVTEHQKAVYYYGDTEGFTPAGYTKSYEVGIKVELYPDNAKVKQFQHADKRSIPLQ
jgi:hypothetical protein